MDIREKLVELLKEGTGCTYGGSYGDVVIEEEIDISDEEIARIAARLIANGVTVLPCKLGDTAWGIKRCNLGNVVKQGEVYQMYFGEDMRLCICVKNVCRGEWGVNVFGTKEEAEEAVGKMAKKEE